ncbi:MAG: hypothetical protein QOH31_1812 [Verrucomicrobiota bacterium]|jgi:hypothetical protein
MSSVIQVQEVNSAGSPPKNEQTEIVTTLGCRIGNK